MMMEMPARYYGWRDRRRKRDGEREGNLKIRDSFMWCFKVKQFIFPTPAFCSLALFPIWLTGEETRGQHCSALTLWFGLNHLSLVKWKNTEEESVILVKRSFKARLLRYVAESQDCSSRAKSFRHKLCIIKIECFNHNFSLHECSRDIFAHLLKLLE